MDDLDEQIFVRSFSNMSRRCGALAEEKGFWDKMPAHDSGSVAKRLLLTISEIIEGFEGYRKGEGASDHIPEFTPLEEEIADAHIRLMDLAAIEGLRVGEAIVAKLKFNAGREYLHNKRF